jgi:hypothetical protein
MNTRNEELIDLKKLAHDLSDFCPEGARRNILHRAGTLVVLAVTAWSPRESWLK